MFDENDPEYHIANLRVSLEGVDKELTERRLQLIGAGAALVTILTQTVSLDWLPQLNYALKLFYFISIIWFILGFSLCFYMNNRLSYMRNLYLQSIMLIRLQKDWSGQYGKTKNTNDTISRLSRWFVISFVAGFVFLLFVLGYRVFLFMP